MPSTMNAKGVGRSEARMRLKPIVVGSIAAVGASATIIMAAERLEAVALSTFAIACSAAMILWSMA
jgi:hypothetical protein